MEHFEATIRVFDVVEPDLATARRTVEERMHSAGFTRWQVVRVVRDGAPVAPVRRPPARRVRERTQNYLGGRALVLAAIAWSLWLLWLLAG